MSNNLQVTTVLGCKNSMLREGLKHILSNTRYDVHSEGLSHCADSLSVSAGASPLLFIVDADLFSADASGAIRALKERHASSRVVILADQFDMNGMMTVLQAGADGYCLSSTGCEALIKYLDLVMLGEVVFPSAMFIAAAKAGETAIGRREASVPRIEVPQPSPVSESRDGPVRNLSSREAEILQCLMQGAPNKVIARRLEVAEATVKVHIKAILRKIRVANRTQAAMWAVNNMSADANDGSWIAVAEEPSLHSTRY